jgi:hypothetical protein
MCPLLVGTNMFANLATSRFSLFQNRRLGDVRVLLPLKMLANRHLLRELE